MQSQQSAPRVPDAIYRELVEQMTEGLCISSPDYIFEIANPALDRIFGVPVGTLAGRSLLEFVSAAGLQQARQQQLQRAQGAPGHYELPISRADGQARMLEVRSWPRHDAQGSYCGSFALVLDITERLEAEAALERSRVQYAQLFAQLGDVALYESGASRQHFSPNLPGMLGMTEAEYLRYVGRFDELIHPDDKLACEAARRAWIEDGEQGVLSLKFRVRHANGRWLWFKDRMVRLRTSDGESFVAGIMIDVTERVAAEEALSASERRLASLIEQSPAAIVALDLDLRFIEWNRAAERTFGFGNSEAIGQDVSLIIPPAELDLTREKLNLLLQDRATFRNVNHNIRRDGSPILCEWFNAPLSDESGNVSGLIATCQDITALEDAAESEKAAQVRAAELETIQRTAATYAHEVNNPLTGIVANTQMLLEQETAGSDRHQMLQEILDAARKIGGVIRAMQNLSKPSYRNYMGRDIIDLSESEE